MNNRIKTWAARAISTTTTTVSIVCCLPQNAMCLESNVDSIEQAARDFIEQTHNSSRDALEEQIIKVVESFEDSTDPVADGYRFLQALLDQVNAESGYSFSMPQFLQQIKENLRFVQIPGVDAEELLEAIKMIEDYSPDNRSEKHWKEHSFHQNPAVKKTSKLGPWNAVVISLITGAALAICIINPITIPTIVEGAVAVGCAALGKKNRK